jgi:NADPH:quinone reductase-like Zn-dependent oxidoreductase
VIARAIGVPSPGRAELRELDVGDVADGCFAVETRFSGVSAGTELTFVKDTNPALRLTWDQEHAVFRHDRPANAYPVVRLGYMEVGVVVESRASDVAEGELVAMAYGHRDRHVADAAAERRVPLPEWLDPLLGVFVAHMGPICANGLLHAAAERRGGGVRGLAEGVEGRCVAVMGGGTVGLLTALFARHHGAAEVALVDRTAARLQAARALDCVAVDERAGPPWLALKERWRHAGGERGADVVFQCRGQDTALAEALRCLRPQGTVVDLAFYPAGAPAVRLGEEFHHNGLTIRCAQVARVPLGLAPAWDRDRLSAETLALLEARGQDVRRHIVTDVVPFELGAELLDDLAERRRHVIQAVLAC